MRRFLSATFAVSMLLAGTAIIYKQISDATPFVIHVFALGGLLTTAGIAWMFLDLAGPED